MMERYFVFLVVHDAVNQEDCQCPKDVIPTLQSLVKDLKEFCNQENNAAGDINNNQYALYDPFLALKDVTSSTVYFSIVEDKLFSHQLEYCSKWQKGEHLQEVSSALDKPVNAQDNADEISSDKNIEISDRLHQLADGLPDQTGVPVDVFWFICAKNNMAIRSHLHLFGALKRLQQWNNANITVLCSNEFDRDTFSTTWQTGLNISAVTQLNRNDAALKLFDPSVVWQGSLVFCKDQSNTKLPGFNLCCDKSKKNVQLHPKRKLKRTSTEVWNSDLCISPEITIWCQVQKHTVPLHMFVPVKLGLKLACSSVKTSARLVEWLSFEMNKDVAFIGSLNLVAPSKNDLKEKNKEAWFNFVKSESISATSTDSKTEGDDSDSCRRLCLICGGAEKELSLFVLRAPEHLNGRIQHDLAVIHSSVSIVNDQEVGGPLRFPDLTDSFLETEQNLTEVLLCRLQQELSDSSSDGQFIVDPSNELLDQLKSEKWKLLKEKREQLLKAGKECELEVVRREALQHDKRELVMSPSRWPERAWLIKNDPNAIVRKDAVLGDSTKHFPLLASVTALSVQDILEKFRLDGTAVASDLSPVKPREEASRERHIQITTKQGAKDVKGERYPEALAASYHGIEYCLDDRAAVAKDSQLVSLQSSHVKLETLSSCVKTDRRPIEKRASRAVTKVARNNKKQNLMKFSVPLIRTKAAGKDRKPANVGRPLKRKSPVVKKTAVAVKREREEPTVQEANPTSQTTKEENKKETRSERHKRRLRQVVQKTLEDNGIDSNHAFYKSCTERLYSLCKSFLKDLRSSHGLNDEMKRLASSNVQQVIEFEAKRTTATQET